MPVYQGITILCLYCRNEFKLDEFNPDHSGEAFNYCSGCEKSIQSISEQEYRTKSIGLLCEILQACKATRYR